MGTAVVLDRRAVIREAGSNPAPWAWFAAIACALSLIPGSAIVRPDPAPAVASPVPVVSPLQLPLSAQALVSQTVGAGNPAYYVSRLGARNPVQRFAATFAPAGVTVRTGHEALRLSLSGG